MISKFIYVFLAVLVCFIVKTNPEDNVPTKNTKCPGKYLCCATCTKQCCGSDIFNQDCEDDCHGKRCSSDDECGDGCCESVSENPREDKKCGPCSKWIYTILLPVVLGVLLIIGCVVVVLARRCCRRENNDIDARRLRSLQKIHGLDTSVVSGRYNQRQHRPFTVESHQFYDKPSFNHVPRQNRRQHRPFTVESHQFNERSFSHASRQSLSNAGMHMELTRFQSYNDHESHAPPSYRTLERYSDIPPRYYSSTVPR